ncbi:MAG: hypothetical protein ABI067_00735 [Leifsonia sp.]
MVAGCVELEGQLDEGCSFFVDADGSHFAAFEPFDGVEVPDGCSPEGAAVLGFLSHLVGDVCSVLAGAVLIEGCEDAVHELPDRCLIDRLGSADQSHAALGEVGHDNGVVVAVPGKARQLVHDDVVDVFLAPHPRQHLLEGDALRHLGRRSTRLDVFVDDGEAQLVGLLLARDALCRDGDALGVVVGVDLPLG